MTKERLALVEAIRKRPGMYIGGTDIRGLDWMIRGAMYYAFHEVSQENLKQLTVELGDSNAVKISISLQKWDETEELPETFLSRIRERGQSSGLWIDEWLAHMVIPMALSSEFEIRVCNDTECWILTAQHGISLADIERQQLPQSARVSTKLCKSQEWLSC